MAVEDFAPKNDKPDVRSMDPWKVIKDSAAALGILINDPKPNCKKCHGRGYIGRHADSGEPIPCTCIFPKSDRDMGEVTFRPRNRKERRAQKNA